MNIDGRISILIGAESTTIEIHDDKAAIKFLEIKLSPDDLSKLLSRETRVYCNLRINGLDKVGKIHEHKYFEFEIPENYSRYEDKNLDKLNEMCEKLLPEGWVNDKYFGSQNSFFQKDGKSYARAVIRRWV